MTVTGAEPMSAIPVRQAILDAYLELMRDRPLRGVSMQRVALAAGCTLADVRRAYPRETDLFFGYAEMVDLAVLAQADAITGTVRERLHQALRLRIEYLVPLRHAIAALIEAAESDPELRETFHAISTVEQTWMLIAAGLRFRGPAARAGVEGLIGAFGATVGGWLSQDDPDAAMQAAMAELNAALDRGEDWLAGLEIDQAARLT
jgi:AcrR family transcriptional regulator